MTDAEPADPGGDLFLRGSFSDAEKALLVEAIVGHLDGVVSPELVEEPRRSEPGYAIGRVAMRAFGNYLDADANWQAIDPRLRVVAYFKRSRVRQLPCEARAFDLTGFLQAADPMLAIEINLDGLPVLLQRTVDLLHDGMDRSPLAVLPSLRSTAADPAAAAALQCSFLAVSFLLMHEMGHVLRGHHALIDGPGIMEGAAAPSPRRAAHDVQRRALELDADLFAAHQIANFMTGYARAAARGPDLHADLPAWFETGLVACYAVFSAFAAAGARPSPEYHSPMVRMHAIAQRLAAALGLGAEVADPRLLAFYGRLACGSERNQAFMKSYVADAVVFRKDWDSLAATRARHAELVASGRLQGWIVEPRRRP